MIGRRSPYPPPLNISGEDIPWRATAKYLGVTIDRQLKMTTDVIAQTTGARAKLCSVLTSRLPLRTRVNIYKGYIRPILTYAAPAWFALTVESSKRRLCTQQNRTLRTIAKTPLYIET